MPTSAEDSNVCGCLRDFCDNFPSRPKLTLENECFDISAGSDTLTSFCKLAKFAYPADGYANFSRDIGPSGGTGFCTGTFVLFDNKVTSFSPGDELNPDCTYARGVVLLIDYPEQDLNGEDLKIVDQKARLLIYDDAGNVSNIPIHTIFSIFTNPESVEPSDLINKIEVVNPNVNYIITVKALVIYTKTNGEG